MRRRHCRSWYRDNWCDAFVFALDSGNDNIKDFGQSDQHKIDISAWGFTSLADMTIIDRGDDTKIEFDATNSVALVGFDGTLQASDFVFG